MNRAKKRFGQHFLHDPGTIDRILRAIAPRPGDRLVEVGPGRGAITVPLLDAAGSLDVVEIDRDVVPELERRCSGHGVLRVHLADALEFDFRALRGGGPRLRLVGNLPYNVSTPLLFHFLSQLDAVADMQPWVRVEPLFDIGTGAFSPPPKVVSTFFALRAHETPPFDCGDRSAFARVVAAAFMQRRKTLRNSLGGLLTQTQITAAGVDPSARPETLPPAQFAALARELVASGARDWSGDVRDL